MPLGLCGNTSGEANGWCLRGGLRAWEPRRAQHPPPWVPACTHSPWPVQQRCGSRLCRAPAIARAACARCHSLCESVNILFTISPIIIHYLSPNPVALETSAAPEAPCAGKLPAGGWGTPHSVMGWSTGWARRGWGVWGKGMGGCPPPAPLLMALGSSRPLWGFLCSFLVVSHQGPTCCSPPWARGEGASSPPGRSLILRAGMAAPSEDGTPLPGMGVPLPS